MLVDRLDLHSCGRTPYRRLSGGQKQRLSFALAIVGRPEIVFLDEPTTGLDPQSRRALWDTIASLRDRGKTVVLTTHYMDEAEVLCDRVSVIDNGRIVATEKPQTLAGWITRYERIDVRISDRESERSRQVH